MKQDVWLRLWWFMFVAGHWFCTNLKYHILLILTTFVTFKLSNSQEQGPNSVGIYQKKWGKSKEHVKMLKEQRSGLEMT